MDATVMSETEIKCDSPDIYRDILYDQMYTVFPVWVTLNAKDKSTTSTGEEIHFTYYQWHNLSYLAPAFGPISG